MIRGPSDGSEAGPSDRLGRRQFLAAAAGAGSALTAGCAFTDVPEETVLRGVDLSNRRDDAIDVDLLVTRYDEVVRWETVSLSARGSAELDLSVPDEPGQFDVYVRVGDRSAATEVSPRHDSDCVRLDVVVAADEFRFARAAVDC